MIQTHNTNSIQEGHDPNIKLDLTRQDQKQNVVRRVAVNEGTNA